MRTRVPIILAHLFGDALLLALAYWWLGTAESDALHLLVSAITFVAFLAGAMWLQGLAFASFCGLPVPQAARQAARHLLPLLTLALCALTLYGLLHWVRLHYGGTAYVVGSYATMKTRKPVAPTMIATVFRYAIIALQWIVIPSLLLPLAAAISLRGWGGFRLMSLQRKRAWLYWIEVSVLLFCAVWVPLRLFFWIPIIESFDGQMVSFLLRVGVGYLLFVGGILTVEFLTSSGSPCVTQSSTVSSP